MPSWVFNLRIAFSMYYINSLSFYFSFFLNCNIHEATDLVSYLHLSNRYQTYIIIKIKISIGCTIVHIVFGKHYSWAYKQMELKCLPQSWPSPKAHHLCSLKRTFHFHLTQASSEISSQFPKSKNLPPSLGRSYHQKIQRVNRTLRLCPSVTSTCPGWGSSHLSLGSPVSTPLTT